MKTAHIVSITPGKCGLYESTWELVAALRTLGHDSRLVDLDPGKNPIGWAGDNDRGVPASSIDWARNGADVVVSHSGIGDLFKGRNPKVIYVAHGRPRVSYLTEKTGGLPLVSYFYGLNYDPKYKAIVTFWPEHVPYLEAMFPMKPVVAVPAPVNLSRWKPGPSDYDFGGKRGEVNVVVADAWREDVDPFLALHAYIKWAREWKIARGIEPRAPLPAGKGPKLHIYGKPAKQPGADALIERIRKDQNLGEVVAWCNDLRPVYCAADFVLTPHSIAVRTHREAMACGCPVVVVGEDLKVEIPKESRAELRLAAARRFDPNATAAAFAKVLEAL